MSHDRPAGNGRPVLVTGATSGIGLATALRLARRGYRVLGTARDDDGAAAIERRAHAEQVEVEVVRLDLTEPDAGADVVPGLDLWALVNNAGWMNVGRLVDVPAPSARLQLEGMVVAPMRLAQLALPSMREHGGGRIVNVVSTAGRVAGPFLGWYMAAKHALDTLTEILRVECTADGIDVVVIEPGGHRTPIWGKAAADLDERGPGSDRPAAYERARSILRSLQDRMPDPDRVAQAIERAVADERPRRRYRVGTDAAVLDVLGSFAPVGLREPVLRRALRL